MLTLKIKGDLQTIDWLPAKVECAHLQAVWQQFAGSSVCWLMITSHFVDSGEDYPATCTVQSFGIF